MILLCVVSLATLVLALAWHHIVSLWRLSQIHQSYVFLSRCLNAGWMISELDMDFIQFLGKFVVFVWMMVRAYDRQQRGGRGDSVTCVHDITLNNTCTSGANLVNKSQYHFTVSATGTPSDPVGCDEVRWNAKHTMSIVSEFFVSQLRRQWPTGQLPLDQPSHMIL